MTGAPVGHVERDALGTEARVAPKRSARNAHKPRASNGNPGFEMGGAQGACVELVPTRDHLLLVAMAA